MALFESVITPHIVHRLGWTLLHFVWQGAIVAFVLAILLRALRKSAANVRYIICCSALVLIVGLPVVTIQLVSSAAGRPAVGLEPGPTVAPTAIPAEPPKELPASEPVAVTETKRIESIVVVSSAPLRERLVEALEPALPHIVVSWLLGVLGLSIWHLGGWTQLQRLRRIMVQPVDRVLQNRVKEIAERLGVRRSVEAMKSALVQVPTVIGWLRPVILLPVSALTGLSMGQLEAILAHELAHIRRYDYLVNILQTVVEILGFYHPAVWWVSHKIRFERENCCDDLAARMAGSERYARALTVMEEIRGRQPQLAVAASGGSLFKRIQRLILPASAQNKDLSWVPAALAILLIIMLAVPTTLGLSRGAAKESNLADDGQVWGTAIEGVQCRLRTDGGKWQAGETPTLKADIRNLGTHQLSVVQHQGFCELWFDGRWYIWAGETGAKSSPLGPGRQYNDIAISLDGYWVAMRNGKPLRPRRRHVVRVAFITESEEGEVIRVHSNPVEIEILPGEGGGDSSVDRAKREAEARRAALGDLRRRISFIGLDLTNAPRRSSRAELPDLFEERPAGSGSYVLRDEVVAARHPEFWEDGVVYYAANKKQFYIIKEPGHPGSGSKTFYGPFDGEPWNRFGMAEPRPAKKQYGLAIYLVVDPIDVGHPEDVTLEQLRLGSVPVLTEEDIVEYDWNEHVLTLTGEAWKHLPAVRSVWGWPFVIVADGERCYLGAFWSFGSSYMPKVPFIGGFRPGWRENKIQISAPDAVASAEDARNDPRIRKVLEKLGIARSAEWPETGESTPAWGEVVDGLQLGLSLDRKDRVYRQGELVGFEVNVRNAGDKEVRLVYEDLAHASPGLRGTLEKPMILDSYFSGGRATVREYRISLRPSELKMLGKVQLQLEPLLGGRRAKYSKDLEAGEYPIRQTVKFGSFTEEKSWRGQLTTGEMKLVVEELTFGPVIEQSLKDQGEASSSIDFDTQRTLTPEMEIRNGVRVMASYHLCRKQGIDAIAQEERGGLAAISMEVAGLNESDWDTMPPREVAKLLKDRNRRIKRVKERGYGIVRLSGDSVFGFKTYEGGIGMVRIVELKEEPWGVKIRYKMAGGVAAETKAAIDVETLLARVRQAQRPAEVMEVEWEFEAGKIPEEVHIAWHRSPVPYEHPEEYKAAFDGVRSRVEYHTEGYKTKEPKGPYISLLDTTVFDGKKQRVLMSREYDGKGQEQFGREREGYNENIGTITKYVNSWPINFNDKKELERYEFSVVDGDKPGVHILELRRDGKLSSRLAIDGNRGFNIVKSESFDAEGRKENERRVTLKKHSNSIWYPSEVETIAYWVDFRKATRPVESTTRITKVRFNPRVSADAFELVFPEGTKVWDKTRGIYLVVGKSGLPEQIDVESVLTRVRQAQRPARNMRIELESEHGGGGMWAVPTNPEERASLTKYRCSAVLSGVRTRYEQRQETYRPKDMDEPSLVEETTYVFDGAKGAWIEKLTKGFESGGRRGYLGLHDIGAVVLRQELFGGDDPPIHSQDQLKEWELTVSESDVAGVLILDARKVNGGGMRLTINGNQGYNIVKKEWLWKDGSTLLEDNFQVKQHTNGVWFVSERERTRYSHEDKTFRDVEAKMKVTGVDSDIEEPEEETFKLKFPPGTKVGVPGGEIVVGEDAEEELREVIESGEKLKGLCKALMIYANEDEEGRFPDTLQQLLEGDYVSKEDLEWLVENVEYLGKGKTAADAHDSPIAYDKTVLQWGKGTNILYLDGHVAFRSMEELEKLPGIQPATMLRLIELKERQESARRLRGLGKALSIYAHEDGEGRFPDTLQQLLEGDYVSKEDLEWLLENVEYLGKGVTAAFAADTLIAYDKTLFQKGKGTNALFLDGHVAFKVTEEVLYSKAIRSARLSVEQQNELVESATRLSELCKALIIYANEDEKGRFPDTLQQLLEGDYVSKEDLEWLVENVEYLGQGKTAAGAPISPIALDKTLLQKHGGTNVLFLDGHIAFKRPKQLKELGIGTGG